MLDKETLEDRCKNLFMEGEEFVLNNGATVLIPSMPVGSVSKPFMRIKDKLSEPEKKPKKVDGEIIKEKVTKVVDGVSVTEEVVVMVPNPDWVDFDSQAGMETAGKILCKILSLNYEVNEEEADGLFSMSHFGEILTFFYTGQRTNMLTANQAVQAASGNSPVPTTTPSPAEGAELLS